MLLNRFYKYANEKLDKFGVYLSFRNYSAEGRAGKFPLRGALALSSYRTSDSIRVEWHFGVMGTRAFVKSEPGESMFHTGFAVPGFSIYSSVQSYSVFGKATKQVGHREVRVAVHDGAIWWTSPFVDPDMWKNDEPWYLRGSFSFVDALFGKVETKRESISANELVVIPMPEGSYPATVSVDLVTHGRPRWFDVTTKMANIKVTNGGIPFPGKGENSYDIDDDAMYSMSMEASSPAEAVGMFVGSVLKRRWANGGKTWMPEPSNGAPNSDDAPNIPSDMMPPSSVHTSTTIAPGASPLPN